LFTGYGVITAKEGRELLFSDFGTTLDAERFGTASVPLPIDFLPQVVIPLGQDGREVLVRRFDAFSLCGDEHT